MNCLSAYWSISGRDSWKHGFPAWSLASSVVSTVHNSENRDALYNLRTNSLQIVLNPLKKIK